MGRSMLDWWRKQDSFHLSNIPNQLKNVQQNEDDFHLVSLIHSPTYPVVFALAAAATNADIRDCLTSYAFAWSENMVQAAVRAVPLGQTDGQRILANLSAQIPAAVDRSMQLMDSERQAFSPMLAILSSQHEAQYSRLFRS